MLEFVGWAEGIGWCSEYCWCLEMIKNRTTKPPDYDQ